MAVRLKINQMEVTAQEGQSVLEVARRVGFSIPSICHHEAVAPIGACRVCLVELKSGQHSQLTTSCNLPVEHGMEVVTTSARIHKQRCMNLELLLARAPGSVLLRNLAAKYGITELRTSPIKDSHLPNCILCELCVRVCEQLDHHALCTIGRGDHKRIGLPFNKPSDSCVGCGSCYSVCPTHCILMKDTPSTRTIWGQTFRFVLCKHCNSPVITEEHRAFAIATKGLGEDYYDVCETCKQASTSRRLASVVW